MYLINLVCLKIKNQLIRERFIAFFCMNNKTGLLLLYYLVLPHVLFKKSNNRVVFENEFTNHLFFKKDTGG